MKFEIKGLADLIKITKGAMVDQVQIGARASELYQHILHNSNLSDEEMQTLLYGEAPNRKANYIHLKNRLSKKLIDNLIVLPNRQDSKYRVAYNECYKNFAAMKLLLIRGAKNSAISLAKQTLKKTRQYELTDLNFQFSYELMQHYALVGEKRRCAHYKNLFEKYLAIYQVEVTIGATFANLSAYFAGTKKMTAKDRAEINELIEEIKNCNSRATSYKITYIFNLTQIIEAQFNNDLEAVAAIGQSAIKTLDQYDFQPSNVHYFSFLYYLIPGLILRGQDDRAYSLIVRCLEMTERVSYNRNITLLYKAVYGFYSRRYEIAEEAYNQAMKHKKEIPANIMEQWKIIEAYICLLRNLGKLETSRFRFRLNKFLNEVPVYSKDKTGANVSIIVVQILLMLSRGERGAVIDRMDALTSYAYKYLKKDNTYRSQCFIKILLQLEKSYFNRIAFRRKTEKYFKLLKNAPHALTDLEVELIPYEDQYELLCQMLRK